MSDRRIGPWWPAIMATAVLVGAACGSDDDTSTPDDDVVTPDDDVVTPDDDTIAPDDAVEPSGDGWNPDPAVPTVISDSGGEQAIPKIAASGSDGFTVSWFSNPGITNYDVRLQRYDIDGRAVWEPGGLLVSDKPSDTFITDYVAAGDDDGNTLLVVQDRRTGSNDIHAYKVSPDGEQLWGDDGITVTDDDGFEAPRPTSVVDDDGALTFSYVRDVDADTTEIVVQRLAADGSPQWGDGIVLGGTAGERLSQSVLAEGPDGAVYVAFTATADFATGVERLQLQRIDADGTIAWDQPVDLAPELPLPAESSLLLDGAGGVYVAWNDTDLRTNVQHVDGDGSIGLGDGGIQPTGESQRLQIRPQLVALDGDAVVVWLDTDESQAERGVAAQRIDRQGVAAWGDSGVTLVEPTRAELTSIAPIATDETLRVFFAQGDPDGDETSFLTRLEAIDVSADGQPGSDRRTVSSRLAEVSDVEVATVGGQHVVAWTERDADGLDALMQNLPLP